MARLESGGDGMKFCILMLLLAVHPVPSYPPPAGIPREVSVWLDTNPYMVCRLPGWVCSDDGPVSQVQSWETLREYWRAYDNAARGDLDMPMVP